MSDDQDKEIPATLQLWEKVSTTDAKDLKDIDGSDLKSIRAISQIKKATELFGVYGNKWGLRNIKADYSLIDSCGLALLKADFFYPLETSEISFEISNSIQVKKHLGDEFSGASVIDGDFAKSLETNTISKALSRLGFNADVYSGEIDKPEYLNERREEAGLEPIEASEDEKLFKTWLDAKCKEFELLPNEPALNKIYEKHLKEARKECDRLGLPYNKTEGGKKGAYDILTAAKNKQAKAIKEKNTNSDN